MKDLIIIGAGGLGREAMSLALRIQKNNPDIQWRLKGFITDIVGDFYEKDTLGYDIIGTIKDHKVNDNNVYVFAIADVEFKKKTTKEFTEKGAKFINLISPHAFVAPNVDIGVGNIIQLGAGIAPNTKIGNFVMINAYTTIGHDAEIGDYTTLSSHCDITGYTKLGEGVFLGSHAVICPHAKVGDYARVGAGSIVLKRVKAHTTVFGNPAKRID